MQIQLAYMRGNLEVITLLLGMQPEYTEYFCFFCKWDSRAKDFQVLLITVHKQNLVPKWASLINEGPNEKLFCWVGRGLITPVWK
jgi:hypothetical protein